MRNGCTFECWLSIFDNLSYEQLLTNDQTKKKWKETSLTTDRIYTHSILFN
jgi:hypothetical protein